MESCSRCKCHDLFFPQRAVALVASKSLQLFFIFHQINRLVSYSDYLTYISDFLWPLGQFTYIFKWVFIIKYLLEKLYIFIKFGKHRYVERRKKSIILPPKHNHHLYFGELSARLYFSLHNFYFKMWNHNVYYAYLSSLYLLI